MRYNRRTFFKKALTGASVTGACYLRLLKTDALGQPAPLKGPSITTDEERKKLIYQAHFGRKAPAASNRGMVICSHPLATREAVKVLKRGGNACDAGLCAAITQTVIEPHMTGITGVFSMLYYDAASGKSTYVNASWNTPLEPLPKITLADIKTGVAQGVPGWWAGFEEAHKRHATKPIKELMEPAIRYARDGFELHPFLWGEIFVQSHRIGMTKQGREIFMPQNVLPRPWEMLYQKRAADTLEHLSEEGSDFYYRGEFAEDFSKVIQEAGGVITRKDMEAYQALWIEPKLGTYRDLEVTSTGSYLLNSLQQVEKMDLEKLGPPTDSAETLYEMIRITTGLGKTKKKETKPSYPGTCHVSAIDSKGNIAAVFHTSNAFPWDNGLFARGVSVCAGGYFLLRKPKPGQRGSKESIPNIIFKDKKPVLVSGSPSISIMPNLIQNITNIFDFGIPIEESVNRPRFGGRSLDVKGACIIEADLNETVRKRVKEKGLRFDVVNPWNWHHGAFEGIYIEPDTRLMRACGDPRRCSKAEGV